MKEIPKWQIVENVVRAIEDVGHRELPELEVTPKAMLPMRIAPDVLREVDVLVTFRAGPRKIRIAVDVKDERKPLDVTMLEQLWAKGQELDVDRYVVVSTSGFASTAREAYSKKGLELVTLEQVGQLAWAGFEHMQVRTRKFDFSSLGLAYDGVEAVEGMGTNPNELIVVGLTGGIPERPLVTYLALELGRAVPDEDDLPEGTSSPTIWATLNVEPDVRSILSLRHGGKSYPFPVRFDIRATFTHEYESRPVLRFRSDNGAEAITCTIPGPDAEPLQVAMIVSGPERKVMLTVGPATPKRSRPE